ncbi:MAG: hypothetical protein CSB06_00435 [Bacteroidia bacterium]|nr:MAG: hypothetical protein CSB06_00435 [Bacteroidia bacterium]
MAKFPSFAQQDSAKVQLQDSSNYRLYAVDTARVVPSYKKRSPVKAALFSALLPGAGQVYNRKFWKVPIVYGTLGLTLSSFFYYNNQYHRYLDGLVELLDYQKETDKSKQPQLTIFDAGTDIETVKKYKDLYRRRRDLMALLFFTSYMLNWVDALVDAHLSDFDVSDDLSMQIRPTVISTQSFENQQYAAGLSLRFKF